MCVIYTGTILYAITITFKAQPTKAGLKPAAVSSSALIANCEDSEETFHKIVLFYCQLQHLTNRAPHRPGPRHAPCTAIATFPLYTAGKQARLINWRNQGNKGVAGTLLLAGRRVVTAAHPSAWTLNIHLVGPGACLHIIYSHIGHHHGSLRNHSHSVHIKNQIKCPFCQK